MWGRSQTQKSLLSFLVVDPWAPLSYCPGDASGVGMSLGSALTVWGRHHSSYNITSCFREIATQEQSFQKTTRAPWIRQCVLKPDDWNAYRIGRAGTPVWTFLIHVCCNAWYCIHTSDATSYRGSHWVWKTWKFEKTFSTQGKYWIICLENESCSKLPELPRNHVFF